MSDSQEVYTRPSWDEYFMEICRTVAKRATCDRGRSGCVITKNNRILVTGYVGSPAGLPHCDEVGHQMVDGHCVRTIHSEINSLTQCAKNGVSTSDTEIYVTHFPCYNCTKALIQSGVKRINYYFNYRDNPLAIKLLQDCGVEYEQIKIDRKYVEQLSRKLEDDEGQVN